MKYCPNCNTQLSDDAKFCSKCGASIQPAPAPSPEAAVPEMDSVVPPIITDETFAPKQAFPQPQTGYEQQPFEQQQSSFEQPPVQPFAQPQFTQPQQFNQPQQFTQPQSQPFGYDQPQMPYEQPQSFQNPDYINPAAPQMPGVTPGKGGSSLIVPIILIILILAVIFIDVFWLFRDQIWGKKDDSSTAASIVTMLNE